ncbi:small membrane protein [Klebsiella pneumoniae]|nr:small membrane protein [Klebsiella pneumoniae]MBM0678048.1 small membrane protein [Klebsiella pneumoniae]MBM0710484.1 small membrane protein [Klebsiella pneumoniae]MBM0738536.1 small membrane protein [Klebsiella pneumoniae]
MSNLLLLVLAVVLLFTSLFFGPSYVREGANKFLI